MFDLPITASMSGNDPMWRLSGFSVVFLVVGFVVGPVIQEQMRLGLASKGNDMCAGTVQEMIAVWARSKGWTIFY